MSGSSSAQARQVPGPAPPQGHGEAGPVQQRGHVAVDRDDQRVVRRAFDELVEDLLLGGGEQLGQHPVHDDRGDLDVGLLCDALGELERLDDRHLLGRRDDDRARGAGVTEDVEHPAGLVADQADLDELVDGLGRGQLTDHVPAGDRVHDHQVVVALPHLVAELADRQDLAHAGRRAGDEVEGARQGTDAREQRHLELQPEVLLERLLGLHRHREEVGGNLPGFEGDGPGLEERGQVALGVDLAHQSPLAAPGSQHPQARRHRRLADATLAGDEEETPIEQPVHAQQLRWVKPRNPPDDRRPGCRSPRS